MKLTRQSGGGRKAKIIENTIMPEEVESAWLEDIILGVIRSHRAEDVTYKNTTEVVNIALVKVILDTLPVVTTKDVMDELLISERQARLYAAVVTQVISFADKGRTKDWDRYYAGRLRNISKECMEDTYADFNTRLTKHDMKSDRANEAIEREFFKQRPTTHRPKPLDIASLLTK